MSGSTTASADDPATDPDRLPWTDFAICGSYRALFFGPFNERPSARRRREARAVRMCGQCPVRLACRDAGRRNHESGIWGGETEEERARAGFAPLGNVRRSVTHASLAGQSTGTGD